MNNRDLKIVGNMLALARRGGKKGKNKRSVMLRTVMPFLSQKTGDQLADAIIGNNPTEFTKVWNHVRAEIAATLHRNRAHASAENVDIGAEEISDALIQLGENHVAQIS